VFQICVEKDSETEKPEHLRKWKGRVVFRGNDVVGENWDVAMFQELGSAPATMVAAEMCDLYGLIRKHVIENADATQAYAQSLLGGTKTWVSLPREEWPESWKGMRRPLCPLVEALYGHPDAGGCWEQHCDGHLEDCRLDQVAPDDRPWRSCYFIPKLKCYVNVDDLKIARPKDNVKKAWELIRGPNPRVGNKGIVLDDPTPAGKFLGCNHEVSHVWAPPMRADRESVQPLEGVPTSDIAGGVQCSHVARVAHGLPAEDHKHTKTNKNNADLIQQPLDGTTRVQDEQPLDDKCSDDIQTTVDEQPDCLPTSGERDPSAGYVCYKQIKYDMSDFLGSCVRLYKNLRNSHDEPLKPAHTPFIDETGDDYGLGGGMCGEAPDGGF
jgi:hypothetical protein